MASTQGIIKLAALCDSLREASFHRGLLHAAMEICNDSIKGMEIEYIGISSLPFTNEDLEVNGNYPNAVEFFRKKIEESDCFLFASPEYNYSHHR